MTPPHQPSDVQALLSEFATAHDVPGAAFGLLRLGENPGADEIATAAHGLLNTATGVEVTDDTVFQIGSITKVFTATLMMQQVEEGNVDLDQPIRKIIPDLDLSDATAADEITVRHLLSHSSGIDGDVFTDHGRGDDCVERYVRALEDVPQIFRPGTMFSYSNSAFVLAGRVLEVITETGWDQLLRDRVIKPLGLEHTSTLPEEAILHRVAVGHEDDFGPVPVDHWQLARAVGPAGLINSSVADVLTFAAAHLRDGAGPDGRLLSAASARAMRESQTPLPVGLHRDGHQGLGWLCDRWDGVPLFGHNGATVGQYAYLQVLPEQQIALCLLTNGSGAGALWTRLRQAVLADHGVEAPLSVFEPPESPEPVAAEVLAGYTGSYGSFAENLEVALEDEVLTVTVTDTAAGLEPDKTPEVLHLDPAGQDGLFSYLPTNSITPSVVRFGTFTPEQSAVGGDYMQAGSRLNRRCD